MLWSIFFDITSMKINNINTCIFNQKAFLICCPRTELHQANYSAPRLFDEWLKINHGRVPRHLHFSLCFGRCNLKANKRLEKIIKRLIINAISISRPSVEAFDLLMPFKKLFLSSRSPVPTPWRELAKHTWSINHIHSIAQNTLWIINHYNSF